MAKKKVLKPAKKKPKGKLLGQVRPLIGIHIKYNSKGEPRKT